MVCYIFGGQSRHCILANNYVLQIEMLLHINWQHWFVTVSHMKEKCWLREIIIDLGRQKLQTWLLFKTKYNIDLNIDTKVIISPHYNAEIWKFSICFTNRPSVHTNTDRIRNFSKTLFKPEEFENSGFAFYFGRKIFLEIEVLFSRTID